ncbi:phage DNA encapsidation protein [bacterium]|nr:phage DNA encapsidation protein [bacterium]
MIEFYNGKNLLSKKDINGKKPKILISCGGRSTGKTTFWNSFVLNKYKGTDAQFILLYRYKYEIDNIANRFFDAVSFKFPDDNMTDKNTENLGFTYLYLNKKLCGFALAINSANNIKKYSSIFSKVKYILFDEIIPEDGRYCPNELQKLLSIYVSVARGNGKAIRDDVQMIMMCNVYTDDNLYFQKFNIKKTHENTKIQRCDGVVVEYVENNDIQKLQESDKIIQLLDDGYITGKKTTDNLSNVEKLKIGTPLFNLYCGGEVVGVYNNEDCIYVSQKTNNKPTYKYNKNEDCNYKYSSVVKMNITTLIDGNQIMFENIHIKNLIIM